MRFTYAFHAREVRFERDAGEGFERIFPETFSFHPDRHDPAELYLQLDDLLSKPRLLAPGARRRDAEQLLNRLLAGVPRYAESVLDHLEEPGRLEPATLERVREDVTLLVQVLGRFISDKQLQSQPGVALAWHHLQKLALRTLRALMETRVRSEYLERYVAGEVDPLDPREDPSETALFFALAERDADAVERCIVGLAQRAFFRWLEGVCLDETNEAFETEVSPFDSREMEVLRAVSSGQKLRIRRGRDITPFLRRPRNRDCQRVLEKLEAWFLRQYDVHHAAVMIRHAAHLARGERDDARTLSRHSSLNYSLLLALLVAPFLGATFFYREAPLLFDVLCSLEALIVLTATFWFLLWRFCWKRDLSLFHTSVPRILAGIIVGYLPVFLIDEVWDLARRSWFLVGATVVLLAFTTLLYLYVEVQRRIGDTQEAFARARSLFLLGVLEAFGVGLVVTSLLGRFMVTRNWSTGGNTSLELLRASAPPVIGDLPPILGIEPVLTFPSAVLLFTFLSFFIGTFLQLMWEDLPITEPL